MLRRVRTLILASLLITGSLAFSTSPVSASGQTPPAPFNPDLSEACGLDFVLVLDRSGSISQQDGDDDLEAAATAFLEAMKDTGSKAAIVSFAETASIDKAATPVTSGANLTALQAAITGLSYGGSTNWEDGLLKAKATFAGLVEPLVIMITDGDPNRYFDPTPDFPGDIDGPGNGFDQDAFEAAQAVAEDIKGTPGNPGNHIFALGVGDINETGLKGISGNDEWNGSNFASADWAKTNFATLDDALRTIATELCGGTVVVEKRLDGQPVGGWHFSATGGATPSSGDTDDDGLVSFDWNSLLTQTTDITETVKPGYAFDGASCTLNQNPVGSAITNGVHLSVGPLDLIRCVFDNRTLRAEIHVEKTASPTTVVVGGAVGYSYAVTNPGEVPLSAVSVTDDKCGPVTFSNGDTNTDGKLDTNETWTYSCATTLAVDTTNTATAHGTPPAGEKVTDTDSAFVDVINPGLEVTKTGPAAAREGDTVTYHFAVKNTGDSPLADVVVTDDKLGAIGTIASLAVGETKTLEKTYPVPASQADIVNTATACVNDLPGRQEPLCDSDNHTLDVIHPEIQVVKDASATEVPAGTAVSYSYTVTNPGDVALDDVTVTDDKCSPVMFDGGDTDSDGELDPGETWSYSCTATITVDTLNTATATGTPPVGPDVTGSDTAVVEVVNPLLRITKTGPAAAHEGDTVTYTFTVTNTGDVTLTNLVVDDDVLGAIGTIESLAAGESAVLTGTYTVPADRSEDVVNTVTVCTSAAPPGVGDAEARLCDGDTHRLDVLHPAISIVKTADPVAITDSGEVTYTYVVENTGDVTLTGIEVTDDVLGAIGSIASLAPGAKETLTKTVTVDLASPTRNVGTATGTDPLGKSVSDDDDETITVVAGQTETKDPDPVVTPASPVEPEVLGETVVQPEATLPRTGAQIAAMVLTGLALLTGGLGFRVAGRRRRNEES